MAHEKTKSLICQHLANIGRMLIAGCGPLMGLSRRACSPKGHRQDAIWFFPEITIRYEGLYNNAYGRNVPKSFSNDGIFIIRPGRWGLNYTPEDRKVIYVGVEIKETPKDLFDDTKCLNYLGWTDFYFFIVPDEMQRQALEKLTKFDDRRFGLISYSDKGDFRVISMPERQHPSPDKILAISNECLFKQTRYAVDFDEDEGIASSAEVNPNLGIHEEYNGRSDNYIKLIKAGICDERGKNCELSGIEAPVFRTKDEIEAELKNNLDQVSDGVIKYMLYKINKTAKRTYFSIQKTCEKEGSVSTKDISNEINIGIRAIERAVKTLKDLGLILMNSSKPPRYLISSPSMEGVCPLLAGASTKRERDLMEGVCTVCTRECSAHK